MKKFVITVAAVFMMAMLFGFAVYAESVEFATERVLKVEDFEGVEILEPENPPTYSLSNITPTGGKAGELTTTVVEQHNKDGAISKMWRVERIGSNGQNLRKFWSKFPEVVSYGTGDVVTLEFDFKQVGKTSGMFVASCANMVLENDDTTVEKENIEEFVRFQGGEINRTAPSASNSKLGNYVADRWYNVKVTADIASDSGSRGITFTYFIDGQKIGTKDISSVAAKHPFNSFVLQFRNGDNNPSENLDADGFEYLIDNVRVTLKSPNTIDISAPTFEQGEGAITQLFKEGEVTGKITVHSAVYLDSLPKMIMALYRENSLANIAVSSPVELEPSGTDGEYTAELSTTLNLELDVQNESDDISKYHIKTFVWSSVEEVQPLVNATRLDSTGITPPPEPEPEI